MGNSGVNTTVCYAASLSSTVVMKGVPKVVGTTGVVPTVKPFPSNDKCYAYMAQVP